MVSSPLWQIAKRPDDTGQRRLANDLEDDACQDVEQHTDSREASECNPANRQRNHYLNHDWLSPLVQNGQTGRRNVQRPKGGK